MKNIEDKALVEAMAELVKQELIDGTDCEDAWHSVTGTDGKVWDINIWREEDTDKWTGDTIQDKWSAALYPVNDGKVDWTEWYSIEYALVLEAKCKGMMAYIEKRREEQK